jgi:hypothetical protein
MVSASCDALERCLAFRVPTPTLDEVDAFGPVGVEVVDDPEAVDEPAPLEASGLVPVPELPADEVDELEEAGAATATPQPMKAAAPTPSATASPPIRPIYLAAPIAFSRVDDHPQRRVSPWVIRYQSNCQACE